MNRNGTPNRNGTSVASDPGPLLDDVVALSRAAGSAIMEVYRSADFGQTRKRDDSPLTAADMAAHRVIVAGLAARTPGLPVLSEEAPDIAYETRSKWQRYWLVDPLDGTREFIKRNGEFTVNIALIENGEPVLGVVHAPVPDVTYYAARGAGAFVRRGQSQPERIRVSPLADGATVKVVASRSHGDARTQALLDKLGKHECVSMGSSLKLCLVAGGAAHFYPRLGPTMEWDTAAAHAVVNEAGGTVCDRTGAALQYNKQDMHNPEFFVYAATDKKLQQWAGDANG